MSVQYLIKSEHYSLTKVDHPKTGRRYYVINITSAWTWPAIGVVKKLHEHFDPTKTRTMSGMAMWKFKTKEEAKELLSLAILKGLL